MGRAIYKPKGMRVTDLLRGQIVKLCEQHNYIPIVELIQCARDPDATVADKISVAKSISEFLYPKMKGFDADDQAKAQGLNVVVMKFGDALEGAKVVKELEAQAQVMEVEDIQDDSQG